MSSSPWIIAAFIVGAAAAFAPQIFDLEAPRVQGKPSYLTATASEVAPVNGLAIYAEKAGLAFNRSDDRPDDLIMAAILESKAEPRNVARTQTEITTTAGTEVRTTYTVDVLLQQRLYETLPDKDLIYSVECSYGDQGITSRVMHRNLGEEVHLNRVSAATTEHGINPAVTDFFCEELMEKPEMPVVDKKPETKPRLKKDDQGI